MPQELEDFFYSDLAIKAASGLSDRAIVEIYLDEQKFFFQKKLGKNKLHKKVNGSADVVFWVNKNAMQNVLDVSREKNASIAKLGVVIFEQIFSRNESSKIYFRVDSGFLSLWSKGYFSVLKLGGPEVAAYIANKGFHSLGKIKEALKSMKGSG